MKDGNSIVYNGTSQREVVNFLKFLINRKEIYNIEYTDHLSFPDEITLILSVSFVCNPDVEKSYYISPNTKITIYSDKLDVTDNTV